MNICINIVADSDEEFVIIASADSPARCDTAFFASTVSSLKIQE
jgi:hypothetical protein